MKKLYHLFLFLFIVYSCSELDDLPSDLSPLGNITTRMAGDSKYDVLGYGYDVTGEYLHPMSVRNPILDVEKYERDYGKRLIYGTSSFGFDRMYYGFSASDYVKNVTSESKATSTMNYGTEKDTIFFSSSISKNSYLKTEYSYSDKYSFASIDAVRNKKYIRINDEISRLSYYLSAEFKEDLNRLTPDRVVERYGTHVLTDFTIGGRYKLMFRSIIVNARDTSTKRQAVCSGFKSSLGKMGFSYNLEQSDAVNEDLAKENMSKELYVLFYGGYGTSLKYDLDKGIPTSVDIQNWENTVLVENSCLTEVAWNETYPIYEFISDPIKKEQIKNAVKRYIAASQLSILNLHPLYSYYHFVNNDHFTTTDQNVMDNYDGWRLLGVEGYILNDNVEEGSALYEYYDKLGLDHYTTPHPNIQVQYPNYIKRNSLGYIYKNTSFDRIPLYEYFNNKGMDHYTSTIYNLTESYPDWKLLYPAIIGYIYPAN